MVNRKYKSYIKLNLVSLFFIGVSFISITLAWFAYSGLATVGTEVGVKAWYVEFQNNNVAVSNDIVISLDDIYPGMETVNEIVNIKNKGDSDAQLHYSIESVRLLDEEFNIATSALSDSIEDSLSHDYPFHVNINLSRGFVLAKGDDSFFEVSISWPLDSANDELDSVWGNKSYEFQNDEEAKKKSDPNYVVRSSIKIVISVTAEQYVEDTEVSDYNYSMGDIILYDVVNNRSCITISDTCIKTRIIDIDTKLSDSTVFLLPDLSNTYATATFNDYNTVLANITNGWNVNTRPLIVNDLLNIISTDVTNSVLVRDGISDLIIGHLNYEDRINKEINNATMYNGYYKFLNNKFIYLASNDCYWTSSSYNANNAFALKTIDTISSKIYPEVINNSCKVVPIIIASKSTL